MMRRLLCLAVMGVCLSGCVLKDRHRYVRQQDECFLPAPDPVPGVAGEKRQYASLDCRSALYKTGFIEFYEDGQVVDPDQERKVLELIASEKRRAGKVITLIYVHGWKNNAHQVRPGGKPKDVERFTTALLELGERARAASPGRPVPVIGVYIGWKGKSLKGPGLFTFVSYWGRRNTANRVGKTNLAPILNRIIEETNTESPASRVLLVGHSFGARVLEHAIESGVTLFDPALAGTVVRPRVDLVLYVNSANDARLSMARVQALQGNPITVRHPDYDPAVCAARAAGDRICREYPLLVAIASRGDLATKFLLPAANRLNLDKSAPTPPRPPDAYIDRPPSPGTYSRAAAAHVRFLQSHIVDETPCPEAGEPACEDAACAFAFRSRGDCTACFAATARATADATARQPFNQTPFWIMDIDQRVIKDHGDIWNQSTLRMLAQLMEPRGFFEPSKGRMQIRAVAR